MNTELLNTEALAHVLLSLQAGKPCAAALPALRTRACIGMHRLRTCIIAQTERTFAPSPVLLHSHFLMRGRVGARIRAHTGASAAPEPVPQEARGGMDGRDGRGVRGLAGLESAYLQAKTVQERQKKLEKLIVTSYTLCPTPLIDLSHCTLARLPHR